MRYEKSLIDSEKNWQSDSYSLKSLDDIHRARRNNKNTELKESSVVESAKWNAAYVRVALRRFFSNPENTIYFIHRKTLNSGIPLVPYRSFYTSSVQFWVGEGCLVKQNKRLVPMILSNNQLKNYRIIGSIKNDLYRFDNANLKSIFIYEKNI